MNARAVALAVVLALGAPIAGNTMTDPQQGETMSRLPDDVRTLRSALQSLTQDVRDLRSRSPFSGTNLRPDGTGGMTLSDVPLQPSIPQTSEIGSTAFALSASWVELAGADLTVPTGCTRLLVTVTARLYAINPNTSGGQDGTGLDALYVSATVAGTASTATPTGVSGNGGFASAFSSMATLQQGLTPGATVHIGVRGRSAYASLASNANNYIGGSFALTWLR